MLPDRPFVAQKKYDIIFVSRLIGKLKKLEYQVTSEEYFESLPERRELAWVYEDPEEFYDEVLRVASARCSSFLVRSHCKSAANETFISSLHDSNALYAYEYRLAFNRVMREDGRVILGDDRNKRKRANAARYAFERELQQEREIAGITLQSGTEHALRREHRDKIQRDLAAKKQEEERKSKPKRERLDDRKRKRELADAMRVELQGSRELLIGSAAAIMGGLFANFLHKGAKAADCISTLIEGIKNAKNQLLKLMGGLWFIPLIIILHWFLDDWKLPLVASAVLSFLPGFLPSGLYDHIRHFFHFGDVQTQSGFEGYATLLSTLFTFSVFRGKINAGKVKEFVTRLSSFDRMAKGWDSLITCVMNGIETLVNFVRKRFGKESIELYTRADRIVHEWAKTAEAYLRDEATGVPMDQQRLDGLLRCIQQGYELKELYRGTDAGKLINTTVSQLGSATMSHLGAIASRDNTRLEPTTVFLYGAPGVGKTLMSVAFVTALLLKSGLIQKPFTAEDVKSQIWQKGTSEYWQGYNRQKAIVMDDAFQNRAFAGDKDNDYFNIIKMVGCFSMPLNFADLASKGKIFFGSQLVFGSTNLSSINAEAGIVIQEPEAVARRIKFGFQLFVVDGYKRDGKLDYKKFVDERAKCLENMTSETDPLCAFPWYMWEVEGHNFLTGANFGPRLPLSTVICDICDSIEDSLKSHERAEQSLNAMIGAFGATPELQAGRQLPRFGELFTAKKLKGLLSSASKELRSDASIVSKFLSVATFVAGGFLAYKLIEAFFGGFGRLLSGLFPSGKVVVNSNRPLTKPVTKYGKRVVVQAGVETTMVDHAYANSYKMYNKSTGVIYGQVLFVCMDMALQPQHFTERLREAVERGAATLDDELVFRSCINADNVHSYTVRQYLSFPRNTDNMKGRDNEAFRLNSRDLDIEFVKFSGLKAHKAIITHFLREGELRYVGGSSVELHICEVDDRRALSPDNKHVKYVYERVAKLGLNGSNGNPLFIPGGRQMNDYYSYPSARGVGDCGAILVLRDARLYGGRCVLGLHCAGVAGGIGAYANIVSQELIEQARKDLNVIVDNALPDLVSRGVVTQFGEGVPFAEMGSFMPIAQLKSPVFICPKTKYKKTALYEEGVYNSYPAILHSVIRDGERTWPMVNAVKPYSTPVLHHDIPRLPSIVRTALLPFITSSCHNSRDLYTFEEAILGIPQEKFRSIPRNTAAGFPYIYDVTGGKKAFFGTDQEYDLTGPKCAELRERVSLVLEQARAGVRLSHVYVDFLKDELRPLAKIESVSTRLISSAPLDYVVAWRMLFGSFSSSIMRLNVEKSGTAPGICSYSDWPRIVRHLQSKGPKVFDGDFKAFDSSEQPCVHDAILDEINAWYNDSAENQRARRVLWEDLVHSRHVGGRGDSQYYLYQWNKSLPSGHPFTTIINSLYALVCLVACYEHLTGDFRFFWDKVAPLTYGDDNVVNISDSVASEYNQITVSRAMSELFGLTYTSGAKVGDLIAHSSIHDVTFLKRRFFLDDGRWLCPLELDSFLYTHFWCKNQKLEREILISNIENALEELSLHPIEVWDKHARHLSDVLFQHFELPTRDRLVRESYLSLVLSRVDEWY